MTSCPRNPVGTTQPGTFLEQEMSAISSGPVFKQWSKLAECPLVVPCTVTKQCKRSSDKVKITFDRKPWNTVKRADWGKVYKSSWDLANGFIMAYSKLAGYLLWPKDPTDSLVLTDKGFKFLLDPNNVEHVVKGKLQDKVFEDLVAEFGRTDLPFAIMTFLGANSPSEIQEPCVRRMVEDLTKPCTLPHTTTRRRKSTRSTTTK